MGEPLPAVPAVSKWAMLGMVSVGVFMATLDSSIVNVALPTVRTALSPPGEPADIGQAQWVVTAYMLVIAATLMPFGRLGELRGKGRIYGLGFLFFILGSALCGLAQSLPMLAAFRGLQGVGASMLMALGPALLVGAFPPGEMGRAMGLIGMVVAAGVSVGPGLGGLLVGIDWRTIFLLNVPLGLLGARWVWRAIGDVPSDRGPFDTGGAVLFGGAISLLVFLLAPLAGRGLELPALLALPWPQGPLGLAAALALLVLFVRVEMRRESPMVDLGLMRHRAFASAGLASLLSFFALSSTAILMPFFLYDVRGFSPTQIGLMLTALPLALSVLAPLGGRLADRVGVRGPATAGILVMGGGLLLLSGVNGSTPVADIVARFLVVGVGVGLFSAPNNSALMGSVPRDRLGLAGGMLALVRTLGGLLGIAASVSMFTLLRAGGLDFTPAMSRVFQAFAIACAAGALFSLARPGPPSHAPGSPGKV
ncbi:MAG: MFS transporter [Euryarchaeota archaeon]|nr:MFS transporter [Euryarchaeota archaeon]